MVPILTDSQICDFVSEDPDVGESEDEPQSPVFSHSEATFMFQQCLTWLERQPEANAYNTCLWQFYSLAAEKRISSLKQSQITTFFEPCLS